MDKEQKCCPETGVNKKNFLSGILFGLIPHSFCLAFALFSIIGTIAATAFLKKILLIPNIFYYLIIISLLFATISVYIYLHKTNCDNRRGIKNNWKYITTLYSTTLVINLFFFYGVIPVLANIGTNKTAFDQQTQTEVTLKVDIPCTGHSFLIMDEINKNLGVTNVQFIAPDTFKVKYEIQNTTADKIAASDIFKTFKVSIQ